jgi:hypothetical protein
MASMKLSSFRRWATSSGFFQPGGLRHGRAELGDLLLDLFEDVAQMVCILKSLGDRADDDVFGSPSWDQQPVLAGTF